GQGGADCAAAREAALRRGPAFKRPCGAAFQAPPVALAMNDQGRSNSGDAEVGGRMPCELRQRFTRKVNVRWVVEVGGVWTHKSRRTPRNSGLNLLRSGVCAWT